MMIFRVAAIASALALTVATGVWAQAENVTGRVQHFDPAGNVLHLQDGRILHLDPRTTILVDGRTVSVNDLIPGATVTIVGAQPAPAPGTPPAAASSAAVADRWARHPAIDASGVVADVDHQTGRVTFEDGRTVKITDGSTVWEPSQLRSVDRGDRVLLRDAMPAGFAGAAAPGTPGQAGVQQHMGTVLKADGNKAQILLSDGRIVKITPRTTMAMDDRRMTIADLQPGDQLVITVAGPGVAPAPTAVQPVQPAPGQVVVPPAAATRDDASALVREDWPVVEIEAQDVRIMRRPQAP